MSQDFFERIRARQSPYIIAELGSNHNGEMELARKLIDAAKAAGADCVKFQSWTKDSIFSRSVYEENYFLADDYRDRSDYNLEKIVEEFSISESELMQMKAYSEERAIDCSSTPFSRKEVDFLVNEFQADFIKVASMDLNNYPFLKYIARKKLPVVLSTGLSELYEIDRAVRTLEEAGNRQIILLHCVAIYPPKDIEVNLRNIESLCKLYPYPVGFSDHTIGFEVPLAAAALGAKIIEKHFTLDTEMFGWDHKVSANPEIMKMICMGSKRVSQALGTLRITCEESDERKAAFRRSIVVKRPLKAGQRIGETDLDFKRPGTGIPPGDFEKILGRRVKVDLTIDQILTWELLD